MASLPLCGIPRTTESKLLVCFASDASAIKVFSATVIASDPSDEYLLCVANFFCMKDSMSSVLMRSCKAFIFS